MPIRAQKRWTALREVGRPRALRRWSASSAWVPLARSRPCLAGPSMTAADRVGQCCGNLTRFAFGLPGRKPVQRSVAVGVEPTGDRLAVDPQVGGDVLACAAAVGHEEDREAVAKF